MDIIGIYIIGAIFKFMLTFTILKMFGPIGSEEKREEFLKVWNNTPNKYRDIIMFITLLIDASVWIISLPLYMYNITKYGLPKKD